MHYESDQFPPLLTTALSGFLQESGIKATKAAEIYGCTYGYFRQIKAGNRATDIIRLFALLNWAGYEPTFGRKGDIFWVRIDRQKPIQKSR
jgi:hypothetical protein